jgi:protease I
MLLKGRNIAVLVEDLYQELEVWYPILRFREEGADVKVIGSGTKDVYKSKLGYEVEVDLEAKKAKVKDFDAVIIPGGYAPDRMRCFPDMVKFVRDMFLEGKCVAAICHAGSMLVSADIVRGKTATSYIAVRDDMVHAGANWVDSETVRDGNLITARKPDDLPAFCREVIGYLTGTEVEGNGKKKDKKKKK